MLNLFLSCISYYRSKRYCSLCRTCCCRRLVIVESRRGQAQESELRAPALVLEASAAHGHKPRRVRRRLAIVHREHLVVRDRVPAPVGEPGGAHVPVPVARALPRGCSPRARPPQSRCWSARGSPARTRRRRRRDFMLSARLMICFNLC